MAIRGSILLADDEEKILKRLGRALRDEGHEVLEAGHALHHVVDDDQIELPFGEVAQRVARVAGFRNLVPLVAQRPAQPLEDLLFVVYEKNRAPDCAHASVPARPGRSMRTSVPSPIRLVTAMVPPRPSTMFLAIGSPRPVPERRVV